MRQIFELFDVEVKSKKVLMKKYKLNWLCKFRWSDKLIFECLGE